MATNPNYQNIQQTNYILTAGAWTQLTNNLKYRKQIYVINQGVSNDMFTDCNIEVLILNPDDLTPGTKKRHGKRF